MTNSQAREELARYGAALYNRGLTPGRTGNLSIRVGERILITPTGACLGQLDSDRLSLVAASGQHIEGDAPSKELPLHLALYDQFGDGQAVAHLHSTHAVAVSCMDGLDKADVLPPITPYYLMRVGKLTLIDYHCPGSEALEQAVRCAAPRGRSLLLANHGSLALGDSLAAAVDAVEEIEETARLFLLLTDRRVRYLTTEARTELLGGALSSPTQP